jgi:hypothetical protein
MTPSTAAEVLAAELSAARAQQGALESRSFAVVTLDVGAVTLYLAIRDRAEWDPVVLGSFGFWAFVAAVVLIGASIAVAIRGALPGRADDLPVAVLIGEPDALIAARTEQLQRARAGVRRATLRAGWALVLALAAIGDVGLLTWWATAGW